MTTATPTASGSICSASARCSVAVGAVQMMLDRGELKDWFGSTEIWVEATVAALCFYLFVDPHRDHQRQLVPQPRHAEGPNFTAGFILMFFVGIILNGTMVLLPTMMQVLMNYPVVTAGFVTAPRGIGTLVAMMSRRAPCRQGRYPADHPHRPVADRDLVVADDRVLAAR